MSLTNTACGNFSNLSLSGSVSGDVANFQSSATCFLDGSHNQLNFINGRISGNTVTGYYTVNGSWGYYDSGTFSLTRMNPVNNTTEFVKQQYRDFLNREADAGGLAHWVNQIDSGAMTRAQVIDSFFWSDEFGARIAPIVRLYFAYFLRIPDYEGLMYWVDAHNSGTSLWAISDSFAGSEEFQQRYGTLSNEAFVDLIYQNILGRAPDSGGYAYWVGELNSGRQTRGQVMVGFSESDEYKSTSSYEVFVTMMYVGMLRRSPEQGGFDFWVDYLDSGNSGLALIDGFLNSQEYASRFQGGAESCVEPPAGLISWWPGDGDAYDVWAGNNGQLLNGTTFTAGRVGWAFSFDGIDDNVFIGNPTNLQLSQSDYTVDAWVNFTSLTAPPGYGFCDGPGCDFTIVSKMGLDEYGEPNRNGWRLLKQSNNRLWFIAGVTGNFAYPGAPNVIQSTNEVTAGEWYHVAAVKTSQTISLYVNGELQESKPLPLDYRDDDLADVVIGYYPAEAARPSFMYGLIDEVEIFNRALSASEIAAIYNAGSAGQCKPQ
jgi:hypothetical protein